MLPSSAPLDPCHCLASPPPIATTCDLCVCIYIKCEVYSCVPPGNLSCLLEVPADTHKVTLRPSSRTQLFNCLHSSGRQCCECLARPAAAVVVDRNNFVDDALSVAPTRCCSANRHSNRPAVVAFTDPPLSFSSSASRTFTRLVMTAAVLDYYLRQWDVKPCSIQSNPPMRLCFTRRLSVCLSFCLCASNFT